MLPVAAMPIDKAEPLDPARLMQELLSVQAELCEVKEQRDAAEDRCRHFEKRCHSEKQVKDREVARAMSAHLTAETQLARSERLREALKAELERTHRRLRGD